jgi:hypothetical protein
MDLFDTFSMGNTNRKEADHWIMLENAQPDPHLLPLAGFNTKLKRSLNDLGRLDYDLKISLEKLRSDLDEDTHDCLHARVAELIQPELSKAMQDLTEAICRARKLTEDVISNGCGPSPS